GIELLLVRFGLPAGRSDPVFDVDTPTLRPAAGPTGLPAEFAQSPTSTVSVPARVHVPSAWAAMPVQIVTAPAVWRTATWLVPPPVSISVVPAETSSSIVTVSFPGPSSTRTSEKLPK